MNKIIEGLKSAIRYAKGDTAGSRTTAYLSGGEKITVEDGCGCVWCDIAVPREAGYHTTARGSFRCTRR